MCVGRGAKQGGVGVVGVVGVVVGEGGGCVKPAKQSTTHHPVQNLLSVMPSCLFQLSLSAAHTHTRMPCRSLQQHREENKMGYGNTKMPKKAGGINRRGRW